MPAKLRHFSINCDDIDRAKNFYEKVFGWTFTPWGTTDYYQIDIRGVATGGLHRRHELIAGQRSNTFRPTFAVDDIRATLATAGANGAKLLMQPHRIEAGPEIGYFEDTEGNICGVGQYPRPRTPDTPPTFRHFAINADDIARAKHFYENVFGWTFKEWGPPNFYQVTNAGRDMLGALQERRELVKGLRTNAFEPTIQVEDIRGTLATVETSGGNVVMRPFRIEGVGDIGFFQDTEGNLCGTAQYLPGTWSQR